MPAPPFRTEPLDIVADRSQWPLIFFEFPHGDVGPHLESYFNELLACFDVARPFATLLDLSHAAMPNPHLRRKMAEFQRDQVDLFGHFMVAQAVWCPELEVAGLITAINWLSEPPMPQRVFQHREEAVLWVTTMLQRKYPHFEYVADASSAPSERRIRR